MTPRAGTRAAGNVNRRPREVGGESRGAELVEAFQRDMAALGGASDAELAIPSEVRERWVSDAVTSKEALRAYIATLERDLAAAASDAGWDGS